MNFGTTMDGTPRTPRLNCSGTHRTPNSHPTFGRTYSPTHSSTSTRSSARAFLWTARLADLAIGLNTWDKYENAVLFAFPHRELELRKYKNYIQGLFLGAPEGSKSVLRFDNRVRTRVAQSGSLRLSDFLELNSALLWLTDDDGDRADK
jgi:hypothetical protein